MRRFNHARAVCLPSLLAWSSPGGAGEQPAGRYDLRVYGPLRVEVCPPAGSGAFRLLSITAQEPAKAAIVASKLTGRLHDSTHRPAGRS